MTKLPWWKRSMMVLTAVVAVIAALAGPAEAGPIGRAPRAGARTIRGSNTSDRRPARVSCHTPRTQKPRPFPKAIGFIKLDESVTWDKEDKHSIAFKRLNSDRGRRMASLLKIDVNKREAGCLGCHSASISEVTNRADQGVQFNPSEGVSCENCHGPYSGWGGEHIQADVPDQGRRRMGQARLQRPSIGRGSSHQVPFLPHRQRRAGQGRHPRHVRGRTPTASEYRGRHVHEPHPAPLVVALGAE